jgi:hypothetical protein
MDNNYFTNVGSYMQPVDPNELARLSPTFQNIGMQQANQNAALAQQNQLVQQAGQTQQGGMNPMAMAMMLRKSKSDPYANAQNAMNQYGAGNVYGFGGQGVVPTTTTGMD